MRSLLFLAWASCAILATAAPAFAAGPEIGQRAPPLVAQTLDGARFSLADSIGKVVLVNFWATWCIPCREEMPAIDAFYRAHRNDGLRLLAISVDAPADKAKVETMMRGFAFPAAMARQAEFKGFGRIWRMPMTFVVDRRGVLRIDGGAGAAFKIDEQWMAQNVAPLLAAP